MEIFNLQMAIPLALLTLGSILIGKSFVTAREIKFNEIFPGSLLASIRDSFRSISSISGVKQRELVAEFLAKISLLMMGIVLVGATLDSSILQISFLACLAIMLLIRQEFNRKAIVVKKYRAILESEFSSFAESLALAVNSGLPFTAAFMRASDECVRERNTTEATFCLNKLRRVLFRKEARRGVRINPLQRELGIIRNDIYKGRTITDSLDQFSARIDSQIISDFVDAIALSLSRGTPIAFLITDHANRIRESQRRMILERAGKAEIKMMIPVVFLLLPISVLFALWPSFQQMQQMVIFT